MPSREVALADSLHAESAAGLARMDDAQPTPMMTIFELMVRLLAEPMAGTS